MLRLYTVLNLLRGVLVACVIANNEDLSKLGQKEFSNSSRDSQFPFSKYLKEHAEYQSSVICSLTILCRNNILY